MTSGDHTPLPIKTECSRKGAVEVHYRADGDLSPGSVMDLGMGKLQLTGQTDFPAGTELELHFGYTPRRPSGIVTMKASVQRSQAGKMAITLAGVRVSEQSKMLSTIRKLAATSEPSPALSK